MRLAEFTDYTLRVLMYCAARPQQRVTIAELADWHGVSKNHLMKVVNDLARQGVLETTRGRGGGLRLMKDPTAIRIGDVVRAAETDFRLVECFEDGTNACTLSPTCGLKRVFGSALQAWFDQLDAMTLADIAATPAGAARVRALPPRRAIGVAPMSSPVSRRPATAKRGRAATSKGRR